MRDYHIHHLKELEQEAIFVMREVAAQFERPVLLFSGGKDSIVMAHVAKKAFHPATIPFPLMHVDTGHNFPEAIEFRDRFVKDLGAELIVASVQESIDKGRVTEETGAYASRNMLQTTTLLDAIEKHKIDAALGGGRRDEEKARAKERFFSHRDEFGQWDPKNQRPELWTPSTEGQKTGEHIRVFPISNWTEMDVWQYIMSEEIDIPSLYFSHQREVVTSGADARWRRTPTSGLRGRGNQGDDGAFPDRRRHDVHGGVVESKADARGYRRKSPRRASRARGSGRRQERSKPAMEDRKKEGYF